MSRVVARATVDGDALAAIRRPRQLLVLERQIDDGHYEALEGPVEGYSRVVEAEAAGDGRWSVVQTVDFRITVPYFGWLFAAPLKRALVRPEGERTPWWAPPDRLDAQAASVLGVLALLGIFFGYLNSVFTRTIAFAGDEFGASNQAQGTAGGAVRLGGLIALVVMAAADRRGRRRVLLGTAMAGSILVATGALAPTLPWLAGSQALARAFATSLLLLVGIMAAEEMPAGARAYAVSLLAMAGGLGAGLCVIALRLADIGERGWRLMYVLPLLSLPLLAGVGRRLPETRRFLAPHRDVPVAGHGGRLWLLAVSGLLANLFVAPQSQFGDRFLRTERGFSGFGIALFTIAAGTPASIGIVAGGRLADVRGRRVVAALALVAGSLATAAYFFAEGWPMWAWSIAGTTISAASIPALGVYGPELFPTSLRGRANGIVAVVSLAGSAAGLVAAGVLSDHYGRIGPAMAILAVGPLLLAVLVLAAYPETAHRQLEDINPEDRPPP